MTPQDQHSIEWFVLGASAIMFVYHFILFLQQRDRYILLYSNYLFSLVVYLSFRRWTHFDTFHNDTFSFAYVMDHPLILYMLFSYVAFISRVLEINNNARLVRFAVIGFYCSIVLFMLIHLYKILFTDETAVSKSYFFVTKSILLVFAFMGLLEALRIRKSVFVRLIIAGGIVYAFCSLLTLWSIYLGCTIVGLREYDLYFIGCLLDILLFSSALGYRSYLMQQEKIETQHLLALESEKNQTLLEERHASLQNEMNLRQVQATINKHLQYAVGASLSSIHVYADLAAKVAESSPDKRNEYIHRIATQSQQIMEDIGDIIWLANISMEDMHEALLLRIRNYSHEILHPHHIAVAYIIDPEYFRSPLSTEIVKDTLIAIKSAMKTAIEQIGHKKMIIEIRNLPDQYSISCS